MSQRFKMPARGPNDGPVSVSRTGPALERIALTVEHSNCSETMLVSEHNACRLYAMLGFVLGIPLSKTAAEALTL